MIAAHDESKLCTNCLEVRPLAEFRHRDRERSARLGQCRDCHNQAERIRRAQLRRGQRDKRIAGFVTQLKNARSNDQVRLLCNAMIQGFGGLQGFVQAWTGQIDRVHRQEPGSKKALDFFLAVARMIEFSAATQPNVAELSDKELHCESQAEVERLVAAQPELAVRAAARLGWTVIPPTENEGGTNDERRGKACTA